MIIVSQDKDSIINFARTQNIWIDDNVLDKTSTTFEICADGEILGEYATEERAKEVLEEITQYYKQFEYFREITIGQRHDDTRKNESGVYEMPKS